MKKTISFAVIHFFNAFMVTYLLSGSLLISSLVAMIEPSINTIAFYIHERVWQMKSLARFFKGTPGQKTISFTVMHFSVAVIVVYLISGDLILSSLIALIEPAVNSFAYFIHELVWQKLTDNNQLKQVNLENKDKYLIEKKGSQALHLSKGFNLFLAIITCGIWFIIITIREIITSQQTYPADKKPAKNEH